MKMNRIEGRESRVGKRKGEEESWRQEMGAVERQKQ